MSFILPHRVERIESPYIVACEGFGDVCLVEKLLQSIQVENCRVGCPSRTGVGGDGKDFLNKYLAAIALAANINSPNLVRGLLVVVDADLDPDAAFISACEALRFAEYPAPDAPYISNDADGFKVAVYLVPGQNETGTLEHLLLRAAFDSAPKSKPCVDSFLQCIGKSPNDNSNVAAKMKMSALVAASFPKNPWATPGPLLQSGDNDLIPVDSPHFKHLANFLVEFCAK
jgi:hypothetical protein